MKQSENKNRKSVPLPGGNSGNAMLFKKSEGVKQLKLEKLAGSSDRSVQFKDMQEKAHKAGIHNPREKYKKKAIENRFGWLQERLNDDGPNGIKKDSRDVCNISISIPQIGTFRMDPTFHELWRSWETVFGGVYVKDLSAAKNIIREKLKQGWVHGSGNPITGDYPLHSGQHRKGQISCLLKRDGVNVLMVPAAGTANGPVIMSLLDITWVSAL